MSKLNRRSFIAATAATAATAVAPTLKVSAAPVTVRYMLWDANQQPAYEAVAKAFMKANPDIAIKVEQLGWGDYWTGVQTGMVSGSAPDVFTNHLAKYPEFAAKDQIMDLNPMIAADKVDTSIYQGELTKVWERDGKRYGLPKDWDTVSILYNKKLFKEAGYDDAAVNEWTWNPDDGGTFGEALKKLTIDQAGKRGNEAGFDPKKIKQYALVQSLNDGYGQTGWSTFAASTGWKFIDEPWTPPFHFDDERFIKTIDWLAKSKLERGEQPSEESLVGTDIETVFAAGTATMMFQGSWMIGWAKDNLTFDFGFARLPKGPEGRRCMINGLADSIWSGTKVKDQAWKWVKYLASKEAQDLVGSYGVVFPAIPSGAEAAQKKYTEKGIDVSAFLDQAKEENGTFLFPIMDKGSEYAQIVPPALQSVGMGQASAEDALPDMNEEVNALYE